MDNGNIKERIMSVLKITLYIFVPHNQNKTYKMPDHKFKPFSCFSSNEGLTLLVKINFSPNFKRTKKNPNPPRISPTQINQSCQVIGITANAVT